MNFIPSPHGYQDTVDAVLGPRRNPDEQIRRLQRVAEHDPTATNYMLLNAALMRAGQFPQPKVWVFNEGWQAQTYFPDGRTISSATVSHDGWWGIGHVTWIGDEEMQDIGDHFVRYYPPGCNIHYSSSQPQEIARYIPRKEEVVSAHQEVVRSYLQDGDYILRRPYYRWKLPKFPWPADL